MLEKKWRNEESGKRVGVYRRLDTVLHTTEGFFFYDETWSRLYGPFKTRNEAKIACAEYARTL